MRLYGTIEKTEQQEDGTIIVSGYASSEDVDSQGEIVTAKAMADALPDYMKFANIREMHQPKAAGVALEAVVQDDGRTWLKAHIIDEAAVKKVQKKVYKGFSIGGKITDRDEANKTIITGLTLSEISLVDRPANGKAVFEMWKADSLPWKDDSLPVEEEKTEPEAPAPDSTEAGVDKAAKGMYAVSTLAQLLASIQYLQQDSQWEAEIEGDNSAMPDQLKAWMKTGGELLAAMVSEEIGEMVGTDDDLENAAKTADLEKAGARNNKSDADKIQSMHDNTVALGADCGAGEKSDHVVDLNKMVDLESKLTKLSDENADLQKRVKELEALPQPAKAMLKVFDKEDDDKAVAKKVEEPKTPHDAIKKAHQTPIKMY